MLGRVDVDHSPLDSAAQHLAERLGRLEAMPGRNRHPPGRDLLRTELSQTLTPELAHRFRQEPAQLLDRLRLRVVLSKVLINEPRERKRAPGAIRPPHTLQRPLERLPRVPLRNKPASLHPSRAAPTGPIPVPPKRGPAGSVRLHREYLTLLRHDKPPRSTTRSRNHSHDALRSDDDDLSSNRGVRASGADQWFRLSGPTETDCALGCRDIVPRGCRDDRHRRSCVLTCRVPLLRSRRDRTRRRR